MGISWNIIRSLQEYVKQMIDGTQKDFQFLRMVNNSESNILTRLT